MLAGLLVGLWILPGARTVGSVTFDIHTLLYAAAAILIGFQSVIFSIFTRFYGLNEGLLPPSPRMERLSQRVNLEVGLVVGASLVVAGLAVSLYAVSDWGAQAFGELDPQLTLRLVIPAATALMLGFQISLSSFFLSVLGLGRRRT